MTYVKMVKCIRISVIDIGVKSPRAGIAHPSGVREYGKVTVTTQLVSCCSEYEKKADGTCQSKLNSS
jgi:hypothetical protein